MPNPPWPHAPEHRLSETGTYFVTGATYLKEHHFRTVERLDVLHRGLLTVARDFSWDLEAWAAFSNHYHFVAKSPRDSIDAGSLSQMLGVLHTRTTLWINRLDKTPGRKVWHNFWDTKLTYQKSYLARLNYVHQNAVKHGLVVVANQYPWCSARWLERVVSAAMVRSIYRFKIDRLNISDDFLPIVDQPAATKSGGCNAALQNAERRKSTKIELGTIRLNPMKRTILSITLAFSVASIFGAETAPDAAELTKLLKDFLAGAGRNDPAAHERFWADDLIYTGAVGRRVGKADILKDVRAEGAPKPGESAVYGAEDIRIQQYGETAIVAFRLVATTEKEGKKETKNYLNSGTFLKRNGKWQVVNWQATALPEKKEPKESPK